MIRVRRGSPTARRAASSSSSACSAAPPQRAFLGPLAELAGAAPAAAGAVTGTISTWSPDTRPDALSSEKWWDSAFTKANPGVKVKQLTVPYGKDSVKLKAGQKTRPRARHALGLHRPARVLRPERPDAQGQRHHREDRPQALPAGRASTASRRRATSTRCPFVGFPFFIYYRKDVYKKLGLKPPTTHAELLANVKATHNPPDQYGYMLTNQAASDTFNLKTAMWTHGAYYFDKQDKLALDRPQTLEAWDFFKALGTYSPPGSLAQGDLDARQLLVDGKVAHMFTTTSFAANIKPDEIENFGAFLYPRKPGAGGASLDFYGFDIPTKAKNPDGAAAMIEFLLDKKNFQEYLKRTVIGWVPMLARRVHAGVPEQPEDQAVQGVHRARLQVGRDRHRRHRLLRPVEPRARTRRDRRREADRRSPRGQGRLLAGHAEVGRRHDQGRALTLAPVSGAEIGERRLPGRVSRLSHDVYLQIAGLALIGPAVVALGVLIVGPFVYVAWQSLFALGRELAELRHLPLVPRLRVLGDAQVGLKITVGSVALELLVAIPLALLLNRPIRGRGLLRGLVTLPWAVPTIAVASAFLWLASPFYGLFNQLGLWSGVLSEPISALGDPRYAIWAVTIATAWKGLPLVFILVMSSLQSLDPQFIEAARVDGAPRHAQFRHVVLPHLRSSIALAGVLSAVYNFSLLDLTFLLTGGGPAGSTTSWPFLLYNQEFDALDTGPRGGRRRLHLPRGRDRPGGRDRARRAAPAQVLDRMSAPPRVRRSRRGRSRAQPAHVARRRARADARDRARRARDHLPVPVDPDLVVQVARSLPLAEPERRRPPLADALELSPRDRRDEPAALDPEQLHRRDLDDPALAADLRARRPSPSRVCASADVGSPRCCSCSPTRSPRSRSSCRSSWCS